MANERRGAAEHGEATAVDPQEALRRLRAGEVRTEGEAVGLAFDLQWALVRREAGPDTAEPWTDEGRLLIEQAAAALDALRRARGWTPLAPGELDGALLRRVSLVDVGGFGRASLTLQGPGWHVLLGDNGAGKSTLLRAIAAALLQDQADLVGQPWARWVRAGAAAGQIGVEAARPGANQPRTFGLHISARGHRGEGAAVVDFLLRDPAGGPGPFFAGFGPFRRFDAGSDASTERSAALPAVAPVLSLFDPGLALRAPLLWLRSLRILELQGEAEGAGAAAKLAAVKALLNHGGLLPAGVRFVELRAEPLSARFVDGQGAPLALDALSDGYRSVLSLVMELLRLMDAHFGDAALAEVSPARPWVDQAGVVLIDEVDAHLHPSWQAEIGTSLTRLFPQVQFIVTTHSPLVARAATGAVHRLSAAAGPGGAQITPIAGVELQRLRWGDLVEALEGPAFGLAQAGQSAEGLAQLERLAALRRTARARPLSPEEEAELHALDAVFLPTEAP